MNIIGQPEVHLHHLEKASARASPLELRVLKAASRQPTTVPVIDLTNKVGRLASVQARLKPAWARLLGLAVLASQSALAPPIRSAESRSLLIMFAR